MVKIHIIAVGKDKDDWVTDGIAHFEKLLSRFARIKWTIISAATKSSSLSAGEIKAREAESINEYLNGGTVNALSDSGRQFDSIKFAKLLERMLSQSSGEIKFIIGGPFGLDKNILNLSDDVISLSSLTYSHQIVRLVLLEQLYRAFSILRGTDYHK